MEENKGKTRIGLIILAAGNSSRLGTPKQLVLYKGETLLEKIIRESLESLCDPIVVVLGKDADKYKKYLKADVKTAENPDWQQGMGTSISYGMKKILEIDDELEGVILCVCDQPFVTADVINNLIKVFSAGKYKIIASAYAETIGVPALFDNSLFSELADLQGNSGAKKIIEEFSEGVFSIDFPDGTFDLDTKEDLQRLQKM